MAKKAAAKAAKAKTVEEAPSLIDQIVEEGRLARDPRGEGARQESGDRVRTAGARRADDGLAGCRVDGQPTHCAD